MLGMCCRWHGSYTCATYGESNRPLGDGKPTSTLSCPTQLVVHHPAILLSVKVALYFNAVWPSLNTFGASSPNEDVYPGLQYSFYAASIAARQLLSLSPTCKEMRWLVLDIGLPALTKQVRLNEQSVTRWEQAMCLMGTSPAKHISRETLGFRVGVVI